MPLTAINGDGKPIDITDFPQPKLQLAETELKCPECGDSMHVRHTLSVRPHFAHNPRNREDGFSCSLMGGESEPHRLAKVQIRDFLRKHSLYKGCDFMFEYSIADGVRRADLMAVFPGGAMEAHEIQLSPVPLQNIIERTNDYESRGYNVFWWIGDKLRNGNTIETWLIQHTGQFGVVQVSNEIERVQG